MKNGLGIKIAGKPAFKANVQQWQEYILSINNDFILLSNNIVYIIKLLLIIIVLIIKVINKKCKWNRFNKKAFYNPKTNTVVINSTYNSDNQ